LGGSFNGGNRYGLMYCVMVGWLYMPGQ
jgi:hypothetical protein